MANGANLGSKFWHEGYGFFYQICNLLAKSPQQSTNEDLSIGEGK